MGAVLLAAGAKDKRYSLPHSRIMIHQPLGGYKGQASDVEIQAKEMLRVKQEMNEILSKHTGQPLKRVAQDTDRDFFMTSIQAQEYGLIDRVVERRELVRKDKDSSK